MENFYFVGLTMNDGSHDYSNIHGVLKLLKAQQVSRRVWMCAVENGKSDHIFALAKQCLSPKDEMLVAEVPLEMRPLEFPRVAA